MCCMFIHVCVCMDACVILILKLFLLHSKRYHVCET